jgi:prepilin-type N-terminal cleavage/methylation domain-containing protein
LRRPTTATTDDASAGFTLLELITVLGVLALLSGIGIGFLSRTDNDLDVAMAVVRDKVRLAYETARQTGRPTAVEFRTVLDEDQIPMAHYVHAKVLEPVGQWHLEPDEVAYAGLRPELRGIPEADGRFGYCMRPDPKQDGTMFAVVTRDQPRFDMQHGFALKLEVNLDRRERCVVASLGPTFRLELDDELRPRASMFLAEPGPRRGAQVSIDLADSELALDRWVTIELVHDGRTLRLLIDGEVAAVRSARGEPFQDGSLFEVSPEDGPVPGRIDEIQLLAYARGEPGEIPAAVTVKGLEKPLTYDRRGQLERPVTLEFILDELKRRKVVAPGGVLQ